MITLTHLLRGIDDFIHGKTKINMYVYLFSATMFVYLYVLNTNIIYKYNLKIIAENK